MASSQDELPGLDVRAETVQTPERMTAIAVSLALAYSDELDIPGRYRPGGTKQKRRKNPEKEYLIEQRFRKNVEAWRMTAEGMLQRLDASRAWRFLDRVPIVCEDTERLTECDDFLAFVDYVILRRDVDECGPDELGCLAALSHSVQQAIQEKLGTE